MERSVVPSRHLMIGSATQAYIDRHIRTCHSGDDHVLPSGGEQGMSQDPRSAQGNTNVSGSTWSFGPSPRHRGRRVRLLVAGVLVFAVAFAQEALMLPASAANPSANLDQCANDSAPSPPTDGCDTSASQWVNGNLGASKASYSRATLSRIG
jgi:hypothetical protein